MSRKRFALNSAKDDRIFAEIIALRRRDFTWVENRYQYENLLSMLHDQHRLASGQSNIEIMSKTDLDIYSLKLEAKNRGWA